MKRCYCLRIAVLICLSMPAWGCFLYAYNLPSMEFSSGYTGVVYQNVFSLEMGTALELAAATSPSNKLRLQLGYRQQFDKMRGEVFSRITAVGKLNRWVPEAGLELGITNRDNFTYDKMLLQEMQIATNKIKSPVYVAWVGCPLAFNLGNGYRLKALDMQFGTHLSHPGRTMRVQIGLINLGRAW